MLQEALKLAVDAERTERRIQAPDMCRIRIYMQVSSVSKTGDAICGINHSTANVHSPVPAELFIMKFYRDHAGVLRENTEEGGDWVAASGQGWGTQRHSNLTL